MTALRLLLLALFAALTAHAEPAPRSLILFIADGVGPGHVELARLCADRPLHLDAILTGSIRTASANSATTDSAAAATAYATGWKTNNGVVAMYPEPRAADAADTAEPPRFIPVATLLETARLQGKATGLVATSTIQHATPAAFSSHLHQRSRYTDIALQQCHQAIDVLFGGGTRFLQTKEQGGAREDGRDLLRELADRGVAVVHDRAAMLALSSTPAWGLFAHEDLPCDIDRHLHPTQPSLPDMTATAIRLLQQAPNGFVLMVEGSKIDWAAHANDPVGVVSELLAFDAAVALALDYARTDGRTLVVAVSDHDTGGPSLRDATTAPQLIAKARLTGEGVARMLGDTRDEATLRQALATHYALDNLSDDEMAKVVGVSAKALPGIIGPIFSQRAAVEWQGKGHTGIDVPLWAYGPRSPRGLMENDQLGRSLFAALDLDPAAATSALFAPVESLFPEAEILIKEDPANPPVLEIRTADHLLLAWPGTNRLHIDGREEILPGITLMTHSRQLFMPAAAARLPTTPAAD